MSNTTEDAPKTATVQRIDIQVFLKAQQGERYRAFIVHAPPRKGKTTFAREVARITGGACIDVLAAVANSPELAATVDLLDADFLMRLALDAAAQGASVVMVDEFDFLVPVWGGNLSQLTELVRKLSVTQTPTIIGFVMQTVPALEALRLENGAGQSRILRLDEIQAIK